MPDGHALRGAVVAVEFARRLGVSAEVVRDAYYLPLLAMAGCTAEADTSASVISDEIVFGEEAFGRDFGRPREVLPVILRLAGRGKGPFGALLAQARALGRLPKMSEVSRAHCEVAVHLAERLGFQAAFREALLCIFERWDGTGAPEGSAGEELPLAVRIAHVAIEANVGHRLGGLEGALAVVKARSGRGLDPALVERFVPVAEQACAGLEHPSHWEATLAAEPAAQREARLEDIEEGVLAIAHFADLKSRYTHQHSTGVAALAAAGARQLRLGDDQERTLRWAGLLHDVGRVAVTAAIWEKAQPLTDAERERIRLHTYAGERVLRRASSLSHVAEIATLAHERLDGSGYHRRLPGSELSMAARLLAAADVFQALQEDRPHRVALDLDRAAAELGSMAKSGQLCAEAVRAVLAAVPHRAAAPVRAGGLTEREVEVLRLVARGLTNKEIAAALDISPKTAGHHLQHVFEKLGVRTRAAATMIAMQRGLVTKQS
jgi:putative nucleotidyltransferase with HDIG domain